MFNEFTEEGLRNKPQGVYRLLQLEAKLSKKCDELLTSSRHFSGSETRPIGVERDCCSPSETAAAQPSVDGLIPVASNYNNNYTKLYIH